MGCGAEDFHAVHVLSSAEAVRQPSSSVSRCGPTSGVRPGPFDIIEDVHGCYDELVGLLGALGYAVEMAPDAPHGRG